MSQTSQQPSVDTEVLVRLQEQTGDEDGELIAELVTVFLEDAYETCVRLQDLAKAGPSDELSREAHRLKSGAANLGALVLTALCKELEHKGPSHPETELRSIVEQMQAEVAQVDAGLQAYVADLSQSCASGA